MKLLAVLLFYVSTKLVDAAPSQRTNHCTALEPCWPSQEEFDQLDQSIQGNVEVTYPLAWPCYEENFDQDQCTLAQQNWRNSSWRAFEGGYQNSLWAPDCPLNQTEGSTCERGLIPHVTAFVQSVEDIQQAINFSREHRLRLRIKGGAHDFLGRSAGEGSFAISTINMKGSEIQEDFTPQNCNEAVEGPVIKIPAGDFALDVYHTAHAAGRVALGPYASTVTISGGWLLGFGHSMVSPRYGGGVDNVLQIEAVTADGEFVTLSECSNPDLFWALKGGGGGIAVVTSATFKTYPDNPILSVSLAISAPDEESYRTALSTFLELQPDLAQKGYSGYSYTADTSLGAPFNLTSTLIMIPADNSEVNLSDANTTFAPLQELSDQGINVVYTPVEMPSYGEYITASLSQMQVGGTPFLMGSRLVAEEAFRENDDFLDYLVEPGYSATFCLVAGGRVSEFEADSSAAAPGWRDAIQHVIVRPHSRYNLTSGDIEEARVNTVERTTRLGEVTGSYSSYVNEDTPDIPNRNELWWGSNYERLIQIKQQYDPNGVLTCEHCVGDENGF